MAIIIFINFHSLYLKSCIQDLVKIGPVVSEKRKFSFLYVNDLVPRSIYYLDLEYSHTFIFSFSCLHLPTFRTQASIVSEKSIDITFSIENPKLTNLTLP